ncbi:MAG: pyridoxamine 5'-phosphate oxidase family protein [Oscillospiraceae bacterium]|nr:pyridoxamine 5'-phosphate oxidase family protein [Oscillospiraceae bacterium]
MFVQMRRKKQQLEEARCIEIIERNTSGVLAVLGEGGYPYAVPLSFVYDAGKIYFHSAQTGHKLDAIARENKASFCVVDKDEVVPAEYTSYFRSVIAFGTIRKLEEEQEKWAAIEKLAKKYAPMDSKEGRDQAILKDYKPLCMLEMRIEHMTGKQSIELMKGK